MGATYGGGRCGWWATSGCQPTARSTPAPAWRRAGRSGVVPGEGHRLVDLVTDAGGGGTLSDRPALAEALVLLRERKARGLVVHRLDRRARDLVLQKQLLAEVWRIGATVSLTVTGEPLPQRRPGRPVTPADPTGLGRSVGLRAGDGALAVVLKDG